MRFMKCSYRARKKNMKTIKIILLIMLRRNLANSEVSGGYRPLTTGWQKLEVNGSNIKYNYIFIALHSFSGINSYWKPILTQPLIIGYYFLFNGNSSKTVFWSPPFAFRRLGNTGWNIAQYGCDEQIFLTEDGIPRLFTLSSVSQ